MQHKWGGFPDPSPVMRLPGPQSNGQNKGGNILAAAWIISMEFGALLADAADEEVTGSLHLEGPLSPSRDDPPLPLDLEGLFPDEAGVWSHSSL